MSDITQVNPALADNGQTVRNPAALSSGDETVVNSALTGAYGAASGIAPGTQLPGGYTVKEALPQPGGEAELWLCTGEDGRQYTAKRYRRAAAVKPEVIAKLRGIRSPYVAEIYQFAELQGRTLEIMQYFPNGSLAGKRFSLEALREHIIPCVNEGLRVLHAAGILHKDIKPSNIMVCADGDSVAIIDFGISSVVEDGSTVIVTRTGMTPECTAPESLHGLFLEESDYYSFGITLYELFTGTTPYHGLSADEITQYTALRRFPYPPDMPPELRTLITGLTYHDITNRGDAANPNRRWTYQQVQAWLRGESLPVPGEGVTVAVPAYTLRGEKYTDTVSLTAALAANWEEGKKHLFRGLLTGHFSKFESGLAEICMHAEEASEGDDPDLIFFRTLYRIDPNLRAFCWRSLRYADLRELGARLLEALRGKRVRPESRIHEILKKRVLSEYVALTAPPDSPQHEAVHALEESYALADGDSQLPVLYMTAFVLSGDKVLRMGGAEIADIPALTKHMRALLAESAEKLIAFCKRLNASGGELDPEFEGWLMAHGHTAEIAKWRH